MSAGAIEKLPGWDAKTVAWSYDMEGHAQKCVDRYCELANKKREQLYKVSSPCLDDHQIKMEELVSIGELSEVCTQIVLKCVYLARIGRPDILWSVNLPDQSQDWFSKIHHTNNYRQYCHMRNKDTRKKPRPRVWRLQIVSTWRRSFRTCRISWQEYRTYQNLQWKLTRPTCYMEMVYDIVEESSNTFGAETHWKFGCIQDLRIRRYWKFIQNDKEIGFRKFGDTKCELSGQYEPFKDEIYIAQWQSSKVDEGKSTRLLGFSIVLGKDPWSRGSNWTMQRPNGELSSEDVFHWAIGIRWRTNWIRVGNCPRIHSIADSSKNPKRSGGSTHWTGRVQDLNKKGNEASCALTSTKIQEYAFEICERTLGICGTRRRKLMVSSVWLQTKRKMGLHCFKNGETFRRNRTSCAQGNKRTEPLG